ncbi:MAG: VWA domain-containing protein, partial [Spirochaetaceae bacterium]|nr:VWA domain-containing protein [Spirochaetaceae bacterium]
MILHFQNSQYFAIFWVILPLVYFLYHSLKRKKTDLKKFTGGIENKENKLQLKGYFTASLLLLISVFFIIIAMTRPSWNQQTKTVEKKGRDVVFLIDVSQSMLADDLIPNRLERAKLAVKDTVVTLDGDRVALVAFAGTAVVKAPLTNDYSFFLNAVDKLSIQSVSKGGSLLGDALRYVNNVVLDNSVKAYKDIILITDGEDQESFPIEAAKESDKKGIRIIAIGLGDEKKGHRIPIKTERGTEFVTFDGQEVWSKLDAETLRKVAGATEGGQYLNVSTGTFDLAEIYGSLVKKSDKITFEEDSVTIYEERFQFFLFMAVLLFAISFFQPFRGFNHLISFRDKKTITENIFK